MSKNKISYLRIRFIIHDWDEEELILKRIREMLNTIPEELRKYIEILEIRGKGLVSGIIKTIEIKSKNRRAIRYILKYIFNGVDKTAIERAMNFDENYSIYIRLDKTDFIVKGITTPRYEEDGIHIKISVDMHKKTKKSVKEELFKVLEQ